MAGEDCQFADGGSDTRSQGWAHRPRQGPTDGCLCPAGRHRQRRKPGGRTADRSRCTQAPHSPAYGSDTHPCWHFGDKPQPPLARVIAPDGTAYAVEASHRLGYYDLFIVSTRTPDDAASWSRPRLTLIAAEEFEVEKAALTMRDDRMLALSYVVWKRLPKPHGQKGEDTTTENKACEIRLDMLRDSDNDGWTDLEEQRLDLDPAKADTDGDGINDGEDVCPTFALPKDHEKDENVQIIQKAFFATVGLTASHYMLIIEPKCAKVHVWGYRGPVLYPDEAQCRAWRRGRQFGPVYVSWEVKRDGDQAQVVIDDYEAPMAAGGQMVYLRKIAGMWYVVRREITWIS